MTKEDLYRVLAQVDQNYLEESEETMRKHKPIKTVLLTAAVIAILTCTVFASQSIRNFIQGLLGHETHHSAVVESPSGAVYARQGVLDVTLKLALPKDAPNTIETFYLPTYLAESWETKEAQRYKDAPETERMDTFFQWTKDDKSISYRQHACPGYNGDYAYDTIGIGYDSNYTETQLQIGTYDLWRISVFPSKIKVGDAVETLDGFQKFYWSDGQYIFTLETSLNIDNAELEMVFESIQSVSDITDYENVKIVDVPTLPTHETKQTVFYPAYLPEGLDLWAGNIVDGCYEFYWHSTDGQAAGSPNIELLQRNDWDEGSIMQWETTTENCKKEVINIKNWVVTFYSTQHKTEVFWKTEECNYVLTSRGMSPFSNDELSRIIESLEIIENPEAYLTR